MIKLSRCIFYTLIALLALSFAIYLLSRRPEPGWPINLIHLLLKYKI